METIHYLQVEYQLGGEQPVIELIAITNAQALKFQRLSVAVQEAELKHTLADILCESSQDITVNSWERYSMNHAAKLFPDNVEIEERIKERAKAIDAMESGDKIYLNDEFYVYCYANKTKYLTDIEGYYEHATLLKNDDEQYPYILEF
jgi:hypothetical protein